MPRRWIVGAAVVGAVPVLAFVLPYGGERLGAAPEPVPRVIETALGDTPTGYVTRNGIEPDIGLTGRDGESRDWQFDYLPDHMGTPGMIGLHYRDGDCEATLPRGRFNISFRGGKADHIGMIVPTGTLSLDDAAALAGDLKARFEAAGWPLQRHRPVPSLERIIERSLGKPGHTLAKFHPCGRTDQSVTIGVTSWNTSMDWQAGNYADWKVSVGFSKNVSPR